MNRIRILLVDDHTLVRAGIRKLLEEQPHFEVVGEAASGTEAIARAGDLAPDVILMDIAMPDLNGLEATRQIRKQHPRVEVLLLTVHDDHEYLFRGLKVGASGYVLKEAEEKELVMAIEAVHRGEMFVNPSMTRRLVADYLQRVGRGIGEERERLEELTDRQREVLQLLANGLSQREIAERLVISPYTVQTHRQNIMRKLNLHSRTELIKYAIRHGLTDVATEDG
jgi:two-component system response regulator NreC